MLKRRSIDSLDATILLMAAPKVYGGYIEHAYRLLFPYEKHFESVKPHLVTLLPSGVIQNEKDLTPKPEKSLTAYPYLQTVSAEKAESFFAEHGEKLRPFLRPRPDGTFAVVQTWPFDYNHKFTADFVYSETNPDVKIFSEEAADIFRQTMVDLFGDIDTASPKILYCHRASRNESPVYVAPRDELLAFLQANPTIKDELVIKELRPDGFLCETTDGKGVKGEKDFTMAPEDEYALYMKKGWMEMACVTPMEQFTRDRELLP